MSGEKYTLMDYIEAGLRSKGIEQAHIEEAKRQIHEDIDFQRMTPEEKLKKVSEKRRLQTEVRGECIPMPSQAEINDLYRKYVETTNVLNPDASKFVRSIVDGTVRYAPKPPPAPVEPRLWGNIVGFRRVGKMVSAIFKK